MTETFTFDQVGNRLSAAGVSPYVYNASNQLTSTPTASYTYDSNGNTETKLEGSDSTLYNWDYQNRLESVNLPDASTVSFDYDPFGRRIRKVSPTSTTIYVYDGEDIIEEVAAAGLIKARYVHGPGIDEPLAMVRGGASYYYNADGQGTITSIMDSTATFVATYDYDSFGNITSSTGTLENPYRYTAREWDDETQLYYYRARYYDPEIGRFLSEDPIHFSAGVNFYTYVKNNSVNAKDPSGLRLQLCCRLLAGLKGWVSQRAHCFLVVSANPSIAGGRGTVIGMERTGSVGTGVLNPVDDVRSYFDGSARCTTVSGCSSCQELQMFKNFGDAGPSSDWRTFGPNSNTYASYQLRVAGCTVPDFPMNAPGSDFPITFLEDVFWEGAPSPNR